MPNNKDKGCLETLILSTLDNKIKGCYENFLECSGEKKKDKGKLQIIYKLIGLSNINYNHINFKPLKDKLKKLIEKNEK